uniref:RING-type E3 ubiquitin transferase n=1 Tax=Kwoniella bestiolae CBS 10118 TaxID=1296100 RepID=A0A1B9G6R3_9TREE|nr:hypothetical protein I302_04422 [Kwoniella bestiolae CBS 10118]OCF26734.1 hypothetical protein I302_04422 [Kwoniella bestiolae CBS 10118]
MADFMPAPPPPHHEDEGDVCRVCRVEGDEADPLIYPCKCSGSVRFVHPDCLKQWLAQTGKKHCEICGHKYTFTKIYPDKLPETIPPTVYIRQTLLWIYRQQLWVARCILVVVTWLIVLPSLNMFSLREETGITDLVGNVTDFVTSNTTEHRTMNITLGGNTTLENATKGISVGDIVDRPISTLFGVLRRAVERWMKGDESSAISFVLRGQILSISLAAVLIGLILLREWITQHNWQEGARPQIVEEGEINPDEWMILNGIARRTTDVMAAILGKAREDRERRMQRLGREQEEREEREQREEAGLRLAQRMLEAAGREKVDEEDQIGSNSILMDLQREVAEVRNEESGEGSSGQPPLGYRPIPTGPDAIASALEEYRKNHRGREESERMRDAAEPQYPDGETNQQTLRDILNSPTWSSSSERFEGEGDAGPSRPRLERVGTGNIPVASVPMEERNGSSRRSKEGEEVRYRAPEMLKTEGEGAENEAGPSRSGNVEEGDIPLFLPPSPTRTASSSSGSGHVFRAGETIRFDENGNLVHDVPRPAHPYNRDVPIAQPPEIAQAPDGEDGDWEDEPEEGEEARVRAIEEDEEEERRANINGDARPLEVRPVQVEFMDEMEEDEQWDRDDWNGMLEVVGLIGPLHGLFQNVLFGVIIMSAAISIFIGLPLLIGKLFLSTDIIRLILSTAGRTLYLIRKVTDPIVDIIFEIVKEVVAIPLFASIRAAETILARKLGIDDGGSRRDVLSKVFALLPLGSTSSSTPAANVEVKGKYIGLTGDGLAWLGQHAYDFYAAYVAAKRRISISNSVSHRLVTVFSGYGVATAIVGLIALPGENGGTISKELKKIVKDHAMFLKLAFFMILELGAFPLGIGLMIDGCTVPLWPGATLLGRLERLRAGPFGVMFLDWLVGTMFMYQFATLLSHIRTLCRAGTLFFIRDPADPNYSPVKDIVEKSAFSQLRKLGTSAVMYSVIVFTLFGGSCWTLAYVPYFDFLPLRLDPTFGPLTSIPFDLLFLHLVVPPTVTYIRPRHRFRKIMTLWWKTTIQLYRLNTLMARRTTTTDNTKLDTRPTKIEKVWPILDPIYQVMFGKYKNESTKARVPASDQVILLPPAQRRAEGGVFIALNEEGVPHTPEDKMRLLKQDRRAREAARDPHRDYEVIELPRYWRTRVHTFIGTTLVMAATVLAVSAFGPIVAGRLASRMVGNGKGRMVHDGYNWLFGAYIIYLSLSLGLFARRHILTLSKAGRLRRSARSTRIKRTLIRYLAGAYGLLTIYGVIPFAVGLLGDVYGSTFSWSRKGSAGGRIVVHFWDTWALGTVTCSLTVGLMSSVNRLKPARGSLLDKLKDQFRNPFPDDLSTTHKIFLPVIGSLLLFISSPFVVTAIVAGMTRAKYGDEVYQALLQAIIPLLLRIFLALAIREYFTSYWGKMRQNMIDAEYVVEERVENYDPMKDEQKKKKTKKGKKDVKPKAEDEDNEDDWEDDEGEQREEDEEGEEEDGRVRDDVVIVQ